MVLPAIYVVMANRWFGTSSLQLIWTWQRRTKQVLPVKLNETNTTITLNLKDSYISVLESFDSIGPETQFFFENVGQTNEEKFNESSIFGLTFTADLNTMILIYLFHIFCWISQEVLVLKWWNLKCRLVGWVRVISIWTYSRWVHLWDSLFKLCDPMMFEKVSNI